MWQVNFIASGTYGWIDFHCKKDAETFASEGYELGLFIQPEVTEIT
jgi:hypothetical protein